MNGEVINEAQCSDGLLFDPVEKICKPEEDVSCGFQQSITLLRILGTRI